MKKLIFIDNHPKHSANDGLKLAKSALFHNADIAKDVVDSMELIADFKTGLTDLEREAILFNPEHVIVTFSMFSEASFDSFGQLVDYLSAAGQHGLTDRVFVDTAEKLERGLSHIIRWYKTKKFYKHIKNAVNSNYLITVSYEKGVNRLTIVRGKIVSTSIDLKTII